MKKLSHKLCRICGEIVIGIRRKDRKSFWYPRQCKQCYKKCMDEKTRKEKISQSLSGMNHPRALPIGSKRIVHNKTNLSYCQIKIKESGKCWVYEHRHNIEKHLNIKLKKYEHVHHKDGNTLNNKITNLLVLAPDEHSSLHHTLATWAKHFDKCIKCNSIKRRHLCHGLCSRCYQLKK